MCIRDRFDRGNIPDKYEFLTGFVDVHKNLLYWSLCAWTSDFEGVVVDYDVFPKQRRTFFQLADASPTLMTVSGESVLETAIYKGLQEVKMCIRDRSITSSISEDVAVFSIVKANEKNIVIDWSTDSGLNWHICVLNESNQVVLTSSKNHIFRVFDGINFVVTDEIPRTYFSADSLKNISLTNSTDWYLDSARTKEMCIRDRI